MEQISHLSLLITKHFWFLNFERVSKIETKYKMYSPYEIEHFR